MKARLNFAGTSMRSVVGIVAGLAVFVLSGCVHSGNEVEIATASRKAKPRIDTNAHELEGLQRGFGEGSRIHMTAVVEVREVSDEERENKKLETENTNGHELETPREDRERCGASDAIGGAEVGSSTGPGCLDADSGEVRTNGNGVAGAELCICAREALKAGKGSASEVDGGLATATASERAGGSVHKGKEANRGAQRAEEVGKPEELSFESAAYIRLVGVLTLVLCAVFFPAGLPIVGRILAALVNRIPKLAGLAGVVSVEAFDAVLRAIEQSKQNAPLQNSQSERLPNMRVEGDLDESLARELDAAHKRLVEVRRRML